MSVTVEIADSKGELWAYRLRRLPPAGDLARYEITRDDTGAVYLVRLTRGAGWECDCPSFTYRRRRQSDHCKHTLECRRLHDLVSALAQPEERP